MWRSCPRCGKIHSTKYKCPYIKKYPDTRERKLRSTYDWTQKSIEIREKAAYLCEVCRERDKRYVYDNVEVHHIEKIKDVPSLYLDNYNLVCLCQEHHKSADAGDISKEYLRKLAYKREHRTDDASGEE